jgi:putative peptidoglycan lipid II flippase
VLKKLSLFTLIYSVSILLSRVIGLVREAVIGRILGTSEQADIYWMAFILPDFLNYLLAGGAIALILIPLLQKYEHHPVFFSKILVSFSALVFTLTAIMYVYMPNLVDLVAPGYQIDQKEKLVELSRLLLYAQPLHLLASLFHAYLQSKDLHKIPAISPLIYTLGIIIGGLFWGPSIGAKGFIYGVLLGAFFGPFLLSSIASFSSGLRLDFQWLKITDQNQTTNAQSPSIRPFYLALIPVMLGFSIVVFDELLMKRYATFLGSGVVSQLQYARSLMKVPMGIFGIALGIATFPTISRLWKSQASEAFLLLKNATHTLILLCAFSQLLLSLCAQELIILIWGTNRFQWQDIQQIASYTEQFSWMIFAWSVQTIYSRGFYAKGQNWLPTLLGSLICLLVYGSYVFFTQTKLLPYFSGNLAISLSNLGIGLYAFLLWLILSFSKDDQGQAVGKILNPTLSLCIKLTICLYLLQMGFHWFFDGPFYRFLLWDQSIWRLLLSLGLKTIIICSTLLLLFVTIRFKELQESQSLLIQKIKSKLPSRFR